MLLISIILIGICLSAREEPKTGIAMETFNLILSRIQQENEKTIPTNLDSRVQSALNAYTSSGAFSDVDYGKTSITNWEPLTHVSRLSDFVFAYTRPDSAYYENIELYDKIVAGLQYWYDRNPRSSNWWYNQISEPQKLGIIMIQMRKGARQIPETLEAKTLERMRTDGGNPAAYTGANKIDIALHWLYRALLTRDEMVLKTAVTQAYAPLAQVSGTGAAGEGIQYDYSFFQHGQQLYTGGYGEVLISDITRFAMYTAGTPYTLSGEKLNLFSKFVRDSYLQVIRGQYMLFDVSGRGGLSRRNQLFKASAAQFIERMQVIDPDNADVYQAAVKRLRGEAPASYGITANHIHFFIGDYTVHSRPEYVFDVRVVSTRTARLESGNGENLKTYYASDGCTNIVQQGNEYDSIFAVWNWTRVPGITAPQLTDIPATKDWGIRGTSSFAGGVSDGRYGVTAYSYDAGYTGVSAKKAWFFFDDEVVCLGSGITAGDKEAVYDVNTTVNQCLLNGEVWVSKDGIESFLPQGEHGYTRAPDWVLHDGIGYVFPQGGHVGVSNKAQTGNWYDINRTQSNRVESKNVFSLWFNHGKQAQEGKYAYIVVPGKENVEAMGAYSAENKVTIWSNTEAIQAVWHSGLAILGIVFYEPGVFEQAGMSISVDKPCVVMLRNVSGEKVSLYIADPAQSQSEITLHGRFSLATGKAEETVVSDFRKSGVYAGATKVYEIGAKE
jgi:chondroitin AC lyase